MELTGSTSTISRAKKLRRELPLPEVLLWQQLRRRFAGLKFRCQHPAGCYVLDFYADAVRLAVDIDGEAQSRPPAGARRSAGRVVGEAGVTTLRISAGDVLHDLDSVVPHIIDVALATTPSTAFGGPPPPAGEDW